MGNAQKAEVAQTAAQTYIDGRWYVAGYQAEAGEGELGTPYRFGQFGQYIAETNKFYGESDEYGDCDEYLPQSADAWVLQS